MAALEALYRDGYRGWNVRHFHEEVCVREHGGSRSYTWVKNRLQVSMAIERCTLLAIEKCTVGTGPRGGSEATGAGTGAWILVGPS